MKRVDRRMIMEFIVPPICAAIGLCLIVAIGIAIYLLIRG